MKDIQFLVLDKNYSIYSIIQPTNTQWNRRYYEAGTFSIQLPLEQYSSAMQYVYTKDRPEMGKIDQVNYKVDPDGFKYIMISGFFLEDELKDKSIYPFYKGVGTHVDDVVTSMVNIYKGDIELLEVEPSKSIGTATDFQASEVQLDEQCYLILEMHQMTYSVLYDFERNKKLFHIWQGTDRTQSQSQNNYVVFSTVFGNLKTPDILQDRTTYKNYAIVKGKDGDSDVYVAASLVGESYYKQVFIDGSSVKYDKENGMTLAQYKGALKSYGLECLIADYQNTLTVEFDVMEGSYEYMTDFDIGDKCDVMIEEMELQLEVRITAIYEVIKDGSHTITLEFGNEKIVSTNESEE